jgi:hypothetical protein
MHCKNASKNSSPNLDDGDLGLDLAADKRIILEFFAVFKEVFLHDALDASGAFTCLFSS